MSGYDSTIWKVPVHDYVSITDFLSKALPEPGITRIGQGDGRVEFLSENLCPATLSPSHFFLVCFSGAMTNRANVTAPLFSGVSIARRLGLPLLSFADPVVSNHKNVTLAWYAGGTGGTDHPQHVAAVIDLIATQSGRIPLLIGGSGGGFAVLNAMQHMAVPSRAVIWNPQTLISAYHREAVSTYVAAAFPTEVPADDTSLHEILESARVQQDVRGVTLQSPSCLLYLQNESDPHVKTHLSPLVIQGEWITYSAQIQVSLDRRLIVGMGNWGYGHAVPPPDLMDAAIELMTQDSGTMDPMDFVPDPMSRLLGDLDIPVVDEPLDIDATATLAGGRVTIRLNAPALTEEMTCAFYLLEKGIRVADRWYTENPEAVFDTVHTDPNNLSIVVFVRHGQGKPVISTIPVNIQNSGAAPLYETGLATNVPCIAIFGSCASADAIFNRDTVTCGSYIARSSLASQIGSINVDQDILGQILSPFQRGSVKADMEKSLWDLIGGGEFDFLLIDFIDDRFDMLEAPSGGIHTLSSEYMSAMSKLGRKVNPDNITLKYSDRKWELWQRGWERLTETLSDNGKLDRLIVNRVLYAQQDETGQLMEGQPFEVENEWLLRIYHYIKNTCPHVQFLHYDPALLIADTNHKWGLSPFHYSSDLYDETIRQLLRI